MNTHKKKLYSEIPDTSHQNDTKKITIVGAGNVGAACANILASSGLIPNITLIDYKKGYAKGKALDINHSIIIQGKGTLIKGTSDYSNSTNSDIIVIAAGIKRTSDMTRGDLLEMNSKIVDEICKNCLKYSSSPIFIIATNPLDSMVYQANISTKLPRHKIIGMAGILDVSRFIGNIVESVRINPSDIKSTIFGSHDENMLIFNQYSSIKGIPISEFISDEKLDNMIIRTKEGGKQIIDLTGTSAYYAPAAALMKIIEAIILDKSELITASVLLEGEYGIKNCCIGVPIVLSKDGIKKILKIKLGIEEKRQLQDSAKRLKAINESLLN